MLKKVRELSSAGRVLGTFAVYYGEPRSPTPRENDLIGQITPSYEYRRRALAGRGWKKFEKH